MTPPSISISHAAKIAAENWKSGLNTETRAWLLAGMSMARDYLQNPQPTIEQACDIARRIHGIAAGDALTPDLDGNLVDLLRRQSSRTVSLIVCDILRKEGLDPSRVHALALALPGIDLDLPSGTRIEFPKGSDRENPTLLLAPGVRMGDYAIDVESLPRSIAAAVPREPLARVLSHPALDPLPLVIEAVRWIDAGGNPRHRLEVGPRHGVTHYDLDLHWPRFETGSTTGRTS